MGVVFVPLTMASLAGVPPKDSGAAASMVNVMQQVGGALGLAILVTIFGTASRAAASHPLAGATAAAQVAACPGARHGRVVHRGRDLRRGGADRGRGRHPDPQPARPAPAPAAGRCRKRGSSGSEETLAEASQLEVRL